MEKCFAKNGTNGGQAKAIDTKNEKKKTIAKEKKRKKKKKIC